MQGCDKCGQPVPPENEAVGIAMRAGMADWTGAFAEPRHFLPVPGCEGSPSRAQYIEDQPRDPRYPYDVRQEAAWREAYAATLAEQAQRQRT